MTHAVRRATPLLVLSAFVVVIALGLSACGKDDNPVAPQPAALERTPISRTFLLDSTFTLQATGSGSYEYGAKFAVTRAGQVMRLACKMPVVDTFRVTLWGDLATTPTPLASVDILPPLAGALTYKAITPVALSPGQSYLVSIHSTTAWYEMRPVAGGSIAYPITTGSVQIQGYQWRSIAATAPPAFPTNVDNTYQAGFADFDFQPN